MTQKKNNHPMVSIIIPVYNGSKYLDCAIDSALSQTYKNIEIIVVNDGSSDRGKTERIAKSYGDKIRYIYKENGGVSTALNLAIDEMRGEYFSWLSHDDTYEPNKVEIEIDYLRKNSLFGQKVIVYSDYYLIDTRGRILSRAVKDHDELMEKPEYALLKGNINGLSLLIPKSAFNDCGKFDTTLKATQDYELWRKMSQTYKFIHIPEILVSTRSHAKQVTNTSPNVISEGNELYLGLINDVSKKRRKELEGSEYCFFDELANFYKQTPFNDVERYCRSQAKKILEYSKKETSKYMVSVIIPFYNNARETIRAVKSVLSQSHNNIEIILVDDGSEIGRNKINKYIENKPIIKLVRQPKNAGVSAARNRGVMEAKGDFVAFLDSDDEFFTDKIKTQLAYMIASKSPMSHTSYIRNMNNEKKVIHSGTDNGHCQKKMMYSCPIATPTVMLNKKWLKKSGVTFNENVKVGEDTIFWLQIVKNNYIVGIDKPLSIVYANNQSHAYDIKKQIIGFKNIIRFLLNDDYYSKLDQGIAEAMKPYINFVSTLNPENSDIDVILSRHNSMLGRGFVKFAYFTKHEGLMYAIKRLARKIIKIISGSNL